MTTFMRLARFGFIELRTPVRIHHVAEIAPETLHVAHDGEKHSCWCPRADRLAVNLYCGSCDLLTGMIGYAVALKGDWSQRQQERECDHFSGSGPGAVATFLGSRSPLILPRQTGSPPPNVTVKLALGSLSPARNEPRHIPPRAEKGASSNTNAELVP
jgi:hypothetical protein